MRIAQKIRLLVLTLVAASSIGIAASAIWGYMSIIEGLQIEGLQRQATISEDRLSLAFYEISHDIRLLAGLPIVKNILADAEADDSTAADSETRDQLASIFAEMLRAKPYYAQVRLIGVQDEGRERVRLDRVDNKIFRPAESDLQRKGERLYFQETIALPRDQIYYSRINLNREKGQIEIPHRPMLRVAMPIFDADERPAGIVIINLDFQPFAEKHLPSNADGRYVYYLTDDHGDYIFHPEKSQTFGFDLGHDSKAQSDFHQLEQFFESDTTSLTFPQQNPELPRGSSVHFRKLRPFSTDRELAMGVFATFEDIGQAANTITFHTGLIVAAMLVIGMVFAFALSERLTRPIANIAVAVEALRAGRSTNSLPVARDDELGSLARSFQDMRESLLSHEAELLSTNKELRLANQDLEHFAHIASHNLREPIRRIATLSNLVIDDLSESDSNNTAPLIETMKRECNRALQQIADFRIFTSIGDEFLVREDVNLRSVVEEILDNFQSKIESTEAVVVVESLPVVSCYRSLVQLIYRKLVENAVQYAKQAGFELRFTVEDSQNGPILGVRNTGSSIETKHHQSVFNLFTRLTNDEDGTGTGLSLCRRAVERHSGQIWLDSGEDFVHFKFTLNGQASESK